MKFGPIGMKRRTWSFLFIVMLLAGFAPFDSLAGSWISIGPDGGNVSQMVASPNFASDNTIFAGTNGAGVFKSTDGGGSWTAVNNGLGNMTVNAVAISPGYASDNTVIAGTIGGIFRTTDGGMSWSAANGALSTLYIFSLALSPNFSSDHTLFAGTNGGGIFKSIDGANSWTAVNSGVGNLYVYSLAASPNFGTDQTIYAGAVGGVYKSVNGGSTWSAVNAGLAIANTIPVLGVALSPNYSTDNTVFALTNGAGAFKSVNAGSSWTAVNAGLSSLFMTAGSLHPSFASNQTLYAGTANGVYMSVNGGNSWTAASNGMSANNTLSVALSPNILLDQTLFSGTKGGAYKSRDNAANWSASNSGIRNMSVKALSISPNFKSDKTIFAVTVGSGIYKSSDGGISWSVNNTSLPNQTVNAVSVSPNFSVDSIVFSGTSVVSGTGGVFKSTDNGSTWNASSSGIDNLNVRTVVPSPDFAADNTLFAGSTAVSTTPGALYKSTNGGYSWTASVNGLSDTNIQSAAVSPGFSGDHTVFVGTPSGVAKSTDGGTHWTSINNGLTTLQVSAVTVSPNFTSDRTAFVGTGTGGVFKTTDGGNTWTSASNGIADLNIASMAISPDYGNHPIVFAGTIGGGVYRSQDGGDNWSAAKAGLGDADMLDLEADDDFICSGTLLGGTSGWSSAWKYDDDEARKNCPTAPPPPPPPATVTSVTPSSGYPGSQVTITGTGFGTTQGTSVVTFNGVPAGSIVSWSDTQIVATVPSVTTTGPVAVIVNGVTSSGNVIFTYYVGANAPDLYVSSLSGTIAASSIYVSDVENNSGASAAGPYTVAFYFSKTAPPNPAKDAKIGTRVVPGLAPGGVGYATTIFTVPTDLSVGNYYLCAVTDFGNKIGELNENNNTLCTTALYVVGPDLIVLGLSGQTTANSPNFYVSNTDQNIGDQPAGSYTDNFYLSGTRTPNPLTDAFLGTRTVASLMGGFNTDSVTSIFTVPPAMPIGSYYLCQMEDTANLVIESSESNNTACTSGTFNISPDLTPTSVSATLSYNSLYVSDTEMNTGNQPAGTFTVSFYLARTRTPNPSTDALIGTRSLSLASGEYSSVTQTLTVPETVPVGSYYVCGIADSDNVVAELVESNNSACTSGTYLIGPDLTVSSLTGSLSSGSLTVSDTEMNIGSEPANTYTVSYYLAKTSTLNPSTDALVGTRSLSLGAGLYNSAISNFTVPTSIPVGTYYLCAFADSANGITESRENNNTKCASGTFKIGPDIVTSSMSKSLSGSNVYVSDTQQDIGSQPAGPFTVSFYLSTDKVYGSGDILLGSRSDSGLGAGAYDSQTNIFPVPSGVHGVYYVIAVSDSGHVVTEYNESNNNYIASGTISIP